MDSSLQPLMEVMAMIQDSGDSGDRAVAYLRDWIGTERPHEPAPGPRCKGHQSLSPIPPSRGQRTGLCASPPGIRELRRQGQPRQFLSRETIWTWEFALPHSWNSLLLKFFLS